MKVFYRPEQVASNTAAYSPSAYKPKRYPAELIAFMKGHGSHKVMFGTNFPMVSPVDCMKELALLDLDEERIERFLWSTAAKVFRL